MKKEAKILLDKAVSSLVLSVEHFNRPSDLGRVEAVLILMDHAFEMLLKSAILHRGGKIREPRAKQTIGFDHCVRKAVSEAKIKFLSDEDALLLQANNSLRDAAQHHLLNISEPHLYIQAQAGVSLFRKLVAEVFGKELQASLPSRVLPLSTTPPNDLSAFFDSEIDEVKKLLHPGKRGRLEALAKLRALAIVEGAVNGERLQPSRCELTELSKGVIKGKTWEELFPGVASINITATGQGPSIDLRISKKEGLPVVPVKEGTPGAYMVALKRVNELDFYNLGLHELASKVNLSPHKTLAYVDHLKLRDDGDCFKQVMIGQSRFNRYSQHSISRIESEIKVTPPEQVLVKYNASRKTRPKKAKN